MNANRKANVRKLTLKDIATAAAAVGAEVDVSLKPKEVDVEPLRQMAIDLDAIYNLAKSREIESLRSASMLLRRISTNSVQFTLTQLENEYWNKPALERPIK